MDELRIRVAGAEDVGVLAALMADLGYPSEDGMRSYLMGVIEGEVDAAEEEADEQ